MPVDSNKQQCLLISFLRNLDHSSVPLDGLPLYTILGGGPTCTLTLKSMWVRVKQDKIG